MQNALRPATSITTGARSTIGARAGGGQYTAGNAERSDFYRSFGVVDRDGQKPGGVDAARGARGRGRWFTSGLDSTHSKLTQRQWQSGPCLHSHTV
jgi:hypothetical protein